jgi:hypothetical protein
MQRVVFTMLSLSLALPLAGCPSDLAGLEGRWQGSIICYEGTSDLTLGLEIEGDNVVGTAQIRAKENNTAWTVSGAAVQSCEEDVCRTDKDCPSSSGEPRRCGADQKGTPLYNPACIEQMKKRNPKCVAPSDSCNPCVGCLYCLKCSKCEPGWMPVQLTFEDKAVILPDPQVKLWRYTEQTLRGTIERYCADSTMLRPEVALHKD